MPKLQFLCTNHRTWLSENPVAAAATWSQSYGRCLELRDEHSYTEALRYAGAAFETADLLLTQQTQVGRDSINRFSDSGLLLMQLLYQLQEARLARAMLSAAVSRLDRLCSTGTSRSLMLEGCQRLLSIDEACPVQGQAIPHGIYGSRTQSTAQIH